MAFKRHRENDEWYLKVFRNLTPSFKNPQGIYISFFKYFIPSHLSHQRNLIVTRLSNPQFLVRTNARQKVIVESWDHPQKSPFLHYSNTGYTWNDDIGNDLIKNQIVEGHKNIYPLKFRYISEFSKLSRGQLSLKTLNLEMEYKEHLKALEDLKFLMYIPCTQSRNSKLFKSEIFFIDQLCQWANKNNRILYIKPKPNGVFGEYDFLKEKYENAVKIGLYGQSNSLKMLNDSYHLHRFLLIKKAQRIINIGTSFVLECAMLNAPIIQIQISNNYPDTYFKEATNNPHVLKYLNNSYSNIYDGNYKNLSRILTENIKSKSQSMSYSKEIKNWINSSEGITRSCEIIYNDFKK